MDDLILGVPQPEGGVDDHEEEGEDDAGEKDEDAAKLVNQEPTKAEGGDHHYVHCDTACDMVDNEDRPASEEGGAELARMAGNGLAAFSPIIRS